MNLIDILSNLKKDNIDESLYSVVMEKYLEQNARINGVPLHGSFELTPYCNLDCKMCYVHLNNNQVCNELLTVEYIKSIIAQAIKQGMMYATLTGGECLLYDGFDEIYSFLINNGIKVTVLTNGLLLDDKRINFFEKYKPKMIQVSIYGSNEQAYKKVTGVNCFNKVIKNVLKAKEMGLNVSLAITPNKYMYDDLKELLILVENMNIPYHINSRLITPREETGKNREDLTDEQYIELYKFLNSLKNEDKKQLYSCEDLVLKNDYIEKKGLKCSGGRSQFLVKWDGRLCACPSMDELGVDITNCDFYKAWKELNYMANTYQIPGECINCNLKNFCLTCPALHKNGKKEGHCDERICARTMKMYNEGFFMNDVDKNKK